MRKQFLFLFLALVVVNTIHAQTRGTKIGYIDMEYILQNVPDYIEAQNQLEQKAQKWKQEIEAKKIEINKLKDALKAEKALLTKGLIDERETEIKFLENEALEYQQNRFGPNGDLMIQKTSLTKPIQDQVFTAVQDIAEAKKYDFIFDKSSDLTMLFAAKRFDISEQVLRVLNRAEKREQLTKKQLKDEEAKENKEDAADENPVLGDRKKALEEKKAARDKVIADRKLLQEEKKKEIEDRKKGILTDKGAKKTDIVPVNSTTGDTEREAAKTAAAEAKQKQIDEKAKAIEERRKVIEDNKKALEEKRKQVLAEREAKKTGTIPASSKTTVTSGNDIEKEAALKAATEAKQKQIDEKAKALEERKKAIEDNKKALEEKRKQILAEREAKKTGTIPASSKTNVTPGSDLEKQAAIQTAAEAKQKQIDEKAKALEERKKAVEDNKKALEEKRKQVLADREAKKTAAVTEEKSKEVKAPETVNESVKDTSKTTIEDVKQKQIDAKAKTLEERKKVIEERKKALEEKKKKALEDREAAKKANEKK